MFLLTIESVRDFDGLDSDHNISKGKKQDILLIYR